MRGLGYVVESKGDEAVARMLREMGRSAADPRPAFEKIRDELAIAEGAWYSSQGAGTWPHLSEHTIAYKQRHGLPSQPLVQTGALLRSLIVKRGSGSRRTITAKSMRYGTRVPYAVFHQEGRGVPERPPLVPVTRPVRQRMVRDVRDYLTRGVGKANPYPS